MCHLTEVVVSIHKKLSTETSQTNPFFNPFAVIVCDLDAVAAKTTTERANEHHQATNKHKGTNDDTYDNETLKSERKAGEGGDKRGKRAKVLSTTKKLVCVSECVYVI